MLKSFLIVVLVVFVLSSLRMNLPPGMCLFLGPPGSGKTSLCSYFAARYMKKQEKVLRRKSRRWYRALFRLRWWRLFLFLKLRTAFITLRYKLLKRNTDKVVLDIFASDLRYLQSHKSVNMLEPLVYSNVPLVGARAVSFSDFGVNLIENGIMLIDEAGTPSIDGAPGLNNRNWKALSNKSIMFLKLYRHYAIGSFALFSQGLDIDQTALRLCERIYLISKLGRFCLVRPVRRVVGVDDETGQLVDKYKILKLGIKFIYLPPYWKYMDTYEAPFLPSKEFPVWQNKTRYSPEIEEEEEESSARGTK